MIDKMMSMLVKDFEGVRRIMEDIDTTCSALEMEYSDIKMALNRVKVLKEDIAITYKEYKKAIDKANRHRENLYE